MNKTLLQKRKRFSQRQARVRAKITGTAERPRLTVSRSLRYIACQLIDDVKGVTLLSASDRTLKVSGKKTERAQAVGQELAKLAQAKGIHSVVFDRAGRAYHGRVKALAEAARAGGLQF